MKESTMTVLIEQPLTKPMGVLKRHFMRLIGLKCTFLEYIWIICTNADVFVNKNHFTSQLTVYSLTVYLFTCIPVYLFTWLHVYCINCLSVCLPPFFYHQQQKGFFSYEVGTIARV